MCGILYIHDPERRFSGPEMAHKIFLGWSAMQHRGQHGGGLAYSDGKRIWTKKFFGLVSQFYNSRGARLEPPQFYCDELERIQERLPSKVLCHLRYATAGLYDDLVHFQPQYFDLLTEGRVVYASNGDIPGLRGERQTLERVGIDFFSDNDAELTLRKICYLKGQHSCSWVEAIQQFMVTTPGAYSGILMTKDKTFFIRDPFGFRPFLVGKINDGIFVAASESCALDIMGAKFTFEVSRGDIVEIDNDNTMTQHPYPEELPQRASHCIFCLDYFARPDTKVFIDERPYDQVLQKGSYAKKFGQELAKEHPVEADLVASIPNSGDLACQGFSSQSGVPEEELFIRNFAIPRTFIMSVQAEREFLVRLKYGLMTDVLKKNPRICLVDDSIVRATTMKAIVAILREAGAQEVHIRISFPPITDPCFMGIAMPTKSELIAASRSVEEIKRFLGVDSLGYLSKEGLARALELCGDDIKGFCTACFTGEYSIPI